MSDIFISYSSKDRSRAKVLAGALERQGWSVWWDRKIPPGKQFSQVIKKAMDEAKCVIVLWSEESVKSEWVQNEASEGARRKILVPALIDDVAIPFEFRRIQAARLVDWEERSPHLEFDTFLKALSAILGQPLLPKASEPIPDEQQPVNEILTLPKAKPKDDKPMDTTPSKKPKKHRKKGKELRTDLSRGPATAHSQLSAKGDSEVPPRDALDHSKPTGLEAMKAWSKSQTAKVLAAICIVTLITIVSIGVFFTGRQRTDQPKTIDKKTVAEPQREPTEEPKPPPERRPIQPKGEMDEQLDPEQERAPEEQESKPVLEEEPQEPTVRIVDPVKAKAEKAWDDVKNLDRALGFGKLLDEAKDALTNAQVFYDKKAYGQAISYYEDVIDKCENIMFLEQQRKAKAEQDRQAEKRRQEQEAKPNGRLAEEPALRQQEEQSKRQPKQGDIETNSIGMKLVYIPAGEFMMGSGHSPEMLAEEYDTDVGRFKDEFPQHQVRISKGFWMGQTEVTQVQYFKVMNDKPWSGKKYVEESDNNPAVYVSYGYAVAFCEELGKQEGKKYRLPTEAEWEYACRSGTTTRFSFGDSGSSLGDHARFSDSAHLVGQKYDHSVGQKQPNPWGLYDMHGNVWEWCSDWYDKEYYYNSPSVDPNGPSSGDARCLRGGSWLDLESVLRCSYRHPCDPVLRCLNVGFRVVCSE